MVMLSMQTSAAFAIQDAAAAARAAKAPVYNQNARTISYAFVFDGPSDKNASFLEQFQKSITASTAPEYIKVRGLDENKWYRINGSEEKYLGAALMNVGIFMEYDFFSYPSRLYHITQTR
jgi:hypothetical protein